MTDSTGIIIDSLKKVNFIYGANEISNIRIFYNKMALIDTIDKNTQNYDLSSFSKGCILTIELDGKIQTKKIILN